MQNKTTSKKRRRKETSEQKQKLAVRDVHRAWIKHRGKTQLQVWQLNPGQKTAGANVATASNASIEESWLCSDVDRGTPVFELLLWRCDA